LFCGVDVGGTSAKIGFLKGRDFTLAGSVPTGSDSRPDHVLAKVAELILSRGQRLCRVGLGTAGIIDRNSGVIRFSPNLPGWNGSHAGEILSQLIDVPVTVDNDCNVFARGAINSGEIPGSGLWLFITLGTGIGGTIINNGEILYGTGGSGEFGHTTVREGGIPCPCGSTGCWETYAGRKALEWYYRRLAGKAADPMRISALASAGDETAREAFREYGRWVGIGLANLANCFAPSGFFMAGGLSAGLNHFGISARQQYTGRCRHPWSVTLLEDSPGAGAYGAASMVRGIC